MADNRTMAELLQAPTEGYEDAIVVPEIEAANFEIKHGLLTLVQNKQFFGNDKEDPHAHIRYFNKITSTLRYPNVPTTSIKLMLFPFSLEGATRIWLEKEPPRSIQTWDDLVAKFINQFFPPSKTTNLRNEITKVNNKLHQLDTFYNALNVNDQDSLNSAAGGNFLDKRPADCSSIIESKSKVRHSRSKAIIAKVSTSTSTSGVSPDVAELKDMEFTDEIGETESDLFGHVLSRQPAQIPEDDLDNLHSFKEVDGILVFVDPQDLLGSCLLADIGLGDSESRTIGFLEGTTLVVVILVKGQAFPTMMKVPTG
ncbi:reverse transcriptase domain-containing protein [Tanacetum coccineum]